MSSPESPSEKQKILLSFIWEYLRTHNRPPVFREMEKAIDVNSTSGVTHHLGRLEKMGLLKREKGVSRGLSLTSEALALLDKLSYSLREAVNGLQIPLVGDIVASEPVELGNDGFANYDHDETVFVETGRLPRRLEDLYALRVRGRSMIDALVDDGDIVILQKVHEVRDGDMVAVWLDLRQEMTLKYIYREGPTTRLQPASPDHKPIFVPSATVEVQGRVVAINRQLFGRGRARPLV
jgi:repressor LexA